MCVALAILADACFRMAPGARDFNPDFLTHSMKTPRTPFAQPLLLCPQEGWAPDPLPTLRFWWSSVYTNKTLGGREARE